MNLILPEGVHYLTSEAYRAGSVWGINIGGILFTFVAFIGLVGIIAGLTDSDADEWLIIAGLFISIVSGTLALISYHENPIYNTQYLVTIEQDVPFSEIQKNYKIINTKDNIITLQPLEPVPWEEDKESN